MELSFVILLIVAPIVMVAPVIVYAALVASGKR